MLVALNYTMNAFTASQRSGVNSYHPILSGGLRAKMFGAGTAEQKEEKLKLLDEQILEREEMLKNARELLESFEKKALLNVEKFHKQKTSDITDILMTYIIMTIDRCKKSKTTWVNIKEACDAM